MKKIYFDYAATSIKRKKILSDILENAQDFDGNPDSSHSYGRESKKILEDSRRIIAKSLNADPSRIIFTSGASESNNTVLKSFKKILTTNIEHDSVENTIDLDKSIILKADKNGLIDMDDFRKTFTDDIDLVSIMMVNNEMGAIEPIKEIGEFLKDKKALFHVDCVQAYGHIDIDVESLNIDFLSLSGHKIGGLNGFGVLYARHDLEPFINGGDQEKDRRAGTSYVMGAYSMAKAYPLMLEERSYIKKLKAYLIESFKKSKLETYFNGDLSNTVDHIVSIYFKDFSSDFLLTYLDMNGICVSAGSACRAGSLLPSKVIKRTYDEDRAAHSIRISLGFLNTKADIDKLVSVLERL